MVYKWYYCDTDGNIIDKGNSISSEPDLQIPMDLAYDHVNNTSKDYYFRCIVGDPVNIREYSEIAKVTVKPTEAKLEKYKEGSIFVGWTADEGKTIYSSDDLSKMVFDKNIELYPVWKTKINIDANGGNIYEVKKK